MDRRVLLALAAIALFAAGFGLGWLVRAEHEAPADLEAAVTAASSDGSVPSGEAGADGGASAGEAVAGASSGGATHDGPDAPSGEGDVAVVGGGAGGSAASGGAGGGAEGAGDTERVAASLDGGAPGRLDADSIQGVVREHRDELGFCFAWQLHSRPELGGRLTMEFVIGPDGQVSESRVVDDELGDETVQRCFVGVTRRMEFPAPEGGGDVTVRYPFILRADGDEAE